MSDWQWHLTGPRAGVACLAGAAAFGVWRGWCWWRRALDFQLTVSGES